VSWQYLRASIDGGFWRAYQNLVRTEVIPFQWKALNDQIPGAPKSHSMENLRIAAGKSQGQFEGMVFQDSDVSKWLEAAGHILGEDSEMNGQIRHWADEAVEVLAAAQQPDGYLNSYFTVKEPHHHWRNLREAHELYCAGHLIEAGVAVYRSTKDRRILEVVTKLADHIDSHFGVGEGKVRGYPGHEEVELALVKLYRLTGERRYLSLAKYFVDERGRSPSYFDQEAAAPDFRPLWGIRELDYFQAHKPVREQTDAVGHAVRAMYLCTAAADIALETDDASLARACDGLWESTTSRRMYITGGIGSQAHHEAFTFDYDLPNDTAYTETCAAIGLFFFAHRMANLRHDGRYADVMERTLYNGIISGLALDGHSYFYVNPLEVYPEACDKNANYTHVKYRRQPWYGCACCPPNVARLLASLGEYLYHVDGDTLYADLFHSGRLTTIVGGKEVSIRQKTDYPWSESITFEFTEASPVDFDLAIRLPAWCAAPTLEAAGQKLDLASIVRNGYAHVRRSWQPGERLELRLPMRAMRVHADPRVRADWGEVAIQRGPIVYCLEEADNGPNLETVTLPPEAELQETFRSDVLGGIVAIAAEGSGWDGSRADGGSLYAGGGNRSAGRRLEPRALFFIPYYGWANRAPGEMAVWIGE